MNPDLLSQLPQILFQIGKALGSEEPLAPTLAKISELVTKLCDAAACSIMLADPEQQILMGKASFGLRHDDIASVTFPYGEGVAGWVVTHAESVCIDDVVDDERFVAHGECSHIRSLVCVPLTHRDAIVGVLTITDPRVGHFTSASVDLLALVAQTIALDMENIRLRRLAQTDALTGAYNRQYLDRRFPIMVKKALEQSEALSIAMFDVDHFKDVNDVHGHDVGDLVLADIARRLALTSREGDRLIRYGGEEFLLLLPGANLATAAEIADRMRVQLASESISLERRGREPVVLDIRISAGVSQLGSSDTTEEFFKRADEALYRAKSNGRNRIEVAPYHE